MWGGDNQFTTHFKTYFSTAARTMSKTPDAFIHVALKILFTKTIKEENVTQREIIMSSPRSEYVVFAHRVDCADTCSNRKIVCAHQWP